MKKICALVLLAGLLLSLAGCSITLSNGTKILFFAKEEEAPATTVYQGPTVPTQPPTAPTAPTVATTVPPTTLPPESYTSETPYLLQIPGYFPIYDGPGYQYPTSRTIGQLGTFTIEEEQLDSSGNLWGKLKSGLGWVDVTAVRRNANR